MYTTTHDLLQVNEQYRSYWTDYCIALYDIMKLGTHGVCIDVYFTDECHGLMGSTDYLEDVSIEIAMFNKDTGNLYESSVLHQTIAHEFIHAKQFASGRLFHDGIHCNIDGELESGWVWEGKLYINTPYNERPWEIEADIATPMLVNNTLYSMR